MQSQLNITRRHKGMAGQLTLLAEAIKASEQLLALVASEKWEDLASLNQSRQHLIQQIDLSDTPPSLQVQVQEQMEKLIALNQQIEQDCIEKRAEAMTELSKIKQSQKVKQAYS